MAFRGVPINPVNPKDWMAQAARVINALAQGKMNVSTLWTLKENATSTTFEDPRIGVESHIILTPVTSNAAAELANGTLYIPETGRVNGQITITHANNSQTDRTFRVSIIG